MSAGVLNVSRCGACTLRYLPREGPCPKCGARQPLDHPIPDLGIVLASTEVSTPPTGWPAPHRLALVELAESVRVLGAVEGALPGVGRPVKVRAEGPRYWVTAAPP